MDLDKDLLGAHDLDNLADVGARLLQETEFFTQQSYARIVIVSLCLEAAKSCLTLEDLELHRLDLVVVVFVERHGGGRWCSDAGNAGKGGGLIRRIKIRNRGLTGMFATDARVGFGSRW